jgi:hypothetical protein
VDEEEMEMAPPPGPSDETDDRQLVPDYSPETVAALFRALESVEGHAHDFTMRYRGQTLYPAFEPSSDGVRSMRVRPLMQDLKKIADEYGWDTQDAVFWMTSPTTWFAAGDRPVDHLDEPARVIAAFKNGAGTQW